MGTRSTVSPRQARRIRSFFNGGKSVEDMSIEESTTHIHTNRDARPPGRVLVEPRMDSIHRNSAHVIWTRENPSVRILPNAIFLSDAPFDSCSASTVAKDHLAQSIRLVRTTRLLLVTMPTKNERYIRQTRTSRRNIYRQRYAFTTLTSLNVQIHSTLLVESRYCQRQFPFSCSVVIPDRAR